MFKFTLTITTSVFLFMSGAVDLFAMDKDNDLSAERNKALAARYQALPDDVKPLIVFHAAFEQCLGNELPMNLALVCTNWFKIIQEQMEEGQPCYKAWYGIFGHEEIYETFLKGVLLYIPIPNSDTGMITLKISELKEPSSEETSYKLLKKNPLEGTFDISKCGDEGKYFVISTGYRKRINPKNERKTEIWIAPHFMIEKQIANAPHLQCIMGNWDGNAVPVGVLVSWSGNLNEDFDYCTSQGLNLISENNLYNIWRGGGCPELEGRSERMDELLYIISRFIFKPE